MKQTVFMIAVMVFFSVRSLADPFWGVFLYYWIAVLRPQAIWDWALPLGVRWSFYAALVAVVTAVMHAGLLREPALPRRFLMLVILFAACVWLSCVDATNKSLAQAQGWELSKIVAMLLLSYFVLRERRHLRYLGWMIFLSLTYLVLEMHLRYLLQGRLDLYHYGYGGLDNNGAGLLIAMVIPFCYFFFWAERRWWRWGYLLSGIAAANMVMLTYSRGAMLSAVLAGSGMVFTTGRRRLRTAVVAVVLVLAVLWLAGPSVRDRFLTISDVEGDMSAQSRFTSWAAAWGIIQDHPLLGVGPGNTLLVSHEYGADVQGRAIHNVYLEVGADSGLPAMFLYAGLLVCGLWWLHKGWRNAKENIDNAEDRWHYYVCKACFWSLTMFMIGATFLSLQQVELPYLLALMGAAAPGAAGQAALAEAETPAGRPAWQPRQAPAGKAHA